MARCCQSGMAELMQATASLTSKISSARLLIRLVVHAEVTRQDHIVGITLGKTAEFENAIASLPLHSNKNAI